MRKGGIYLNGLGRRIVVVVVRLVVLVPVVTRLDPVEVSGFARPVLIVPPVRLRKRSARGIKRKRKNINK